MSRRTSWSAAYCTHLVPASSVCVNSNGKGARLSFWCPVMKRAGDELGTTGALSKQSRPGEPSGTVSRDIDAPPNELPRRDAPRPNRIRGECVDFSEKLCYGFIRPDDLGPTVFVHQTEVLDRRPLWAGSMVEFEWRPPREGENAARAARVRIIGEVRTMASSSDVQPAWRPPLRLVPRAVTTQSAPRVRPSSEASVLGNPWYT